MALHIHHFLLLSLAILQAISAVRFVVENDAGLSAGGVRFTEEIGSHYAEQVMETTTNFIWDMFEQEDEEDQKHIDQVTVFIVDYDGAEAITYGETITVSGLYLKGFQGNVTWEFTSLLYHEMTHVWQWNGAGQAPNGLIEGVADYTVLKAGYDPPGFAKPGMGDMWDQGYDFTARFLEYCEGIRPGFVAGLNRMMKDEYSVGYFDELVGKSVEDLWREYKEKYGYVSGRKTKFRRWRDYRAKHG